MKYSLITTTLILFCIYGNGQRRPAKQGKDTLSSLGCPLLKGIMHTPSQEGYGYKGDLKMIITSATDTLLLAPVDGKVDLITIGEGGKYEIVMHHNDYNIWLTGIGQVLAKKNDLLKKGQILGHIKPGDEIEFLFFNDEEPVDPGKWLDCHK
jgi:hypothetical protein